MIHNDDLISIIVPVYMIEDYIGCCIESIVLQTYRNLEIILVDDGSKDRSSDICDLYAKKDNRIKVIHQSNQGLVGARKSGLKLATGEYITYVDGDDWIENDYIESLYKVMINDNSDIVCAGFSRDIHSKSVKFSNNLRIGIYKENNLSILYENMISKKPYFRFGISTYVWNKLFKKNILYDIQMNVDNRIKIGEDAAVTYPAILNSKIISIIDNTDYHYRQHEKSMLKNRNDYSLEVKQIKYLYDYLLNISKQYNNNYNLEQQIFEYILSILIIRFGILFFSEDITVFNHSFKNKKIVVYSAGTFGQQLVKQNNDLKYCEIVRWVDDDFWEYRRSGLDVDPVDSINDTEYDYVVIATVDSIVSNNIVSRLRGLEVVDNKIIYVDLAQECKLLLDKIFLKF